MKFFERDRTFREPISKLTTFFMVAFHIGAIAALFMFTWKAFFVAVALWWIAGSLGIGMAYHRLLTHRGFKTYKWVEYFLTICATLALEGGPTAAQHKEMSPDFLEEMLELRMHIEELREGGDPAALSAMERELQQRRSGTIAEIAGRFAQYEALAVSDAKRRGLLVEVRQLLNAAKFIQGQLRDLRAD